MSEWQDIATAPKNGSSILAFDPMNQMLGGRSRILVMRWDTSFNAPGKWKTDIHPFVVFNPTHWMPLPKDPA